nr:unnamed protein product [Digitaria exilis]
MRRPAGSVRRAAAAAVAILFGALVLIALVMDDGEKAALLPAISGRKTMSRADGEQRTPDGFKTDDTFQDSKRRVPNGPDPIHNRLHFGKEIPASVSPRWEPASPDDHRAEHDGDGTHVKAWKLLKRQTCVEQQTDVALHCKEEEEQTRGALWWVWLECGV